MAFKMERVWRAPEELPEGTEGTPAKTGSPRFSRARIGGHGYASRDCASPQHHVGTD
jgi:hypothetical protein